MITYIWKGIYRSILTIRINILKEIYENRQKKNYSATITIAVQIQSRTEITLREEERMQKCEIKLSRWVSLSCLNMVPIVKTNFRTQDKMITLNICLQPA